MRQIFFTNRLSTYPYTLDSLETMGSGNSDSYRVYLAKAVTESLPRQCRIWTAQGALNEPEQCITHPIRYVLFRDLDVPANIDATIV